MIGLLALVAAGLAVAMSFAWLIQRLTGNTGWVDVVWTLGTGAAGVVFALAPVSTSPAGWRQLTVAVLVALWLFLEHTPFGRILRAGSRDPEMVGLLGINLPKVLTWVFGLGCAISGIAGVLAAPLWTITPSMATNAIMPAFVVVAIGGLGSFAGAVIAGLMVGVVIALTIQFYPSASGAVMYLFMALMLLLRPRGLLGERWERFE